MWRLLWCVLFGLATAAPLFLVAYWVHRQDEKFKRAVEAWIQRALRRKRRRRRA